MRWVDLESVIQSEVSQREKQILYANIYMESKKKNGTEEPRGRTEFKTQM